MIFRPFTGTVSMALTVSLLSPAFADAQNINFPYEHVTDSRGLQNVFHAFRRSCLEQPVSGDLAERLVPEGYKVVPSYAHWGWEDNGGLATTGAVLSKTGLEESDWEGGFPFVEFTMPTDARPQGGCSVAWQRAWDYKTGQDALALGLFGVVDVHVSYVVGAILISEPERLLHVEGLVNAVSEGRKVSGVSDWVATCWDGQACKFQIIYAFDPDDGVDVSITRTGYYP